jgi:hypothetical protein
MAAKLKIEKGGMKFTIEEFFIFSNSSHLDWKGGAVELNFEGPHPGTMPARFGFSVKFFFQPIYANYAN